MSESIVERGEEMSEEQKLLEITVDAEELPERLLVNGLEYRQVDKAPDGVAQQLHDVAEFFYSKWKPEAAAMLVSRWDRRKSIA